MAPEASSTVPVMVPVIVCAKAAAVQRNIPVTRDVEREENIDNPPKRVCLFCDTLVEQVNAGGRLCRVCPSPRQPGSRSPGHAAARQAVELTIDIDPIGRASPDGSMSIPTGLRYYRTISG
jgi:hypothetical protein